MTRAAAALLTAVGLPAAAQPPAAKPAAAKPAAAPAAEPLELKEYPVAGVDPADVALVYPALFAKLAGKGVSAPRTTMLAKGKTLLVRGTKAQLEATDAVLAVLQGQPAASGAAAAKGAKVLPLRAIRVEDLMGTLQALDLADQVLPLRASNAVVLVAAGDPAAEQVRKVVDLLEKAAPPLKPGSKPAPVND